MPHPRAGRARNRVRRASLLLRSPFIAAGEAEAAGRARLDLELRRRAEPAITLERLLNAIDDAGVGAHAPELAQRLRQLAEFRKSDLFAARAPSAWARAITAALKLMGFPDKGRSLDSAEYQTLKKWHEVIAGFALLDGQAKMGCRRSTRGGWPIAISRPPMRRCILGVRIASRLIW